MTGSGNPSHFGRDGQHDGVAGADVVAVTTPPGGGRSEPGRRLRINFILPRVGLSGGVKSNRLIAEAMVRRGHDVTIAYIEGDDPWPSPWRVRQFTRRLIEAWNTRGLQPHHMVRSTARLIALRDRQRIEPADVPDADVTIATWWETAEWISDWPESKGLKAHFVRGYETWGGPADRVDAVYRLDTHKLVIASWLQRLMAEKFDQPGATLVPNGVDWDQFDSTPRPKQPVPTVGLAYSPLKLKGCDVAFKAIKLVRKQLPDLRVVAFGSYPLAGRQHPPDGIEFHLRPEQRRIPELYRGADCWLISSTTEGFSMPGLEAAACRCPVVSTRCGGPEDYVRPGETGYLVDVGDAEEMARRLHEVVTLDDARWRQMSEAAYATARRFDWDRSAEILEQSLAGAIGARAHQTVS